LDHAQDWILFEANIGSHICIDESALSQGELYTIITNASAACQKGSLIAMVRGTKSEDVIRVLEKIPLKERKRVKQVTVDLARNMEKIGRISFPKCTIISDRFHVQQLPSEALQEMRITYRWEAIKEENEALKKQEKNILLKYLKTEILKNNYWQEADTSFLNQKANGPILRKQDLKYFLTIIPNFTKLTYSP
jgi:transposase